MLVGPAIWYVGGLSAMRVGGWTVARNQAPPAGLPWFPPWPAMHRLRKAFDSFRRRRAKPGKPLI